jgi:AN1-type zinc finger and ubiquitin domain-containing protein 1
MAIAHHSDMAMDLTIEAVTGTIYDLCVSPFETILGIKTKIQRLEGIPISQQHLVFGSTELMDDYCLEEYGIQSGSQLKLIIGMRGGPIHSQRIHLEDSALLELAEYLDIQTPDDNEQCTFMLLSDDIDGRSQLQSPIEISESRMSGSQTSLVATVQPPPKVTSLIENIITHDKMKDIQGQLQNLRLNRNQPSCVMKNDSKRKRSSRSKLIVLDNNNSFTSSMGVGTPPSKGSFGYKCPSSSKCPSNHLCCHCPTKRNIFYSKSDKEKNRHIKEENEEKQLSFKSTYHRGMRDMSKYVPVNNPSSIKRFPRLESSQMTITDTTSGKPYLSHLSTKRLTTSMPLKSGTCCAINNTVVPLYCGHPWGIQKNQNMSLYQK